MDLNEKLLKYKKTLETIDRDLAVIGERIKESEKINKTLSKQLKSYDCENLGEVEAQIEALEGEIESYVEKAESVLGTEEELDE